MTFDTANDRFALLFDPGGYPREWAAGIVPPHFLIKRTHCIGHPGVLRRDFEHALAEGSYPAMLAAERLLSGKCLDPKPPLK